MAKVIATIGGVALAPGISKNRRWYRSEVIAKAYARAQERIGAGEPLTMLSHHEAGDDSTRIAASLTGVSLDEEGRLRWSAGIADTDTGRTIASLTDTSDGRPPHLENVSIRGHWIGTVRKVRGPDGQPVETADDLALDGLDFTKSPGVAGAAIDTFTWSDRAGRTETTERVYITESVQEARVTITEETGPAAAPVISEAVLEAFGGGHVLDNGLCVTCEAAGSTGGTGHADPGYQDDKKPRYDLTTRANAKAAWTYIGQKDNAARYTANQLKRIKGRIKAALSRFGVTVAAESGWLVGEPLAVSEALAEWWPGQDPQTSGSYCLSACNGPTSLTISSCSLDPEDLDPVLRAAADAACKALAALDPDMDGDIDVPGAGHADTDHDMGRESADDDEEMDEAAKAEGPVTGVTSAVKSTFLSSVKRDTPVDIAAGMRRLSQWAASGHYPQGTSYADLKWFYDQCAKELKSRDPKSTAGGNFPAQKAS
jgi:hypothetical protein